jgi:hypothetical protein
MRGVLIVEEVAGRLKVAQKTVTIGGRLESSGDRNQEHSGTFRGATCKTWPTHKYSRFLGLGPSTPPWKTRSWRRAERCGLKANRDICETSGPPPFPCPW